MTSDDMLQLVLDWPSTYDELMLPQIHIAVAAFLGGENHDKILRYKGIFTGQDLNSWRHTKADREFAVIFEKEWRGL